nr:zinc finger, CCHC-type [Tanacetum cinerariifolium]
MKCLKEKIQAWIKTKKENSYIQKKNLKADLAKIDLLLDKGEGDYDILNKRVYVSKSLQDKEKMESMEVAQKAKIKWAVKGDENSKYYHVLKFFPPIINSLGTPVIWAEVHAKTSMYLFKRSHNLIFILISSCLPIIIFCSSSMNCGHHDPHLLHSILPSTNICGESDFTITNVSVFVTAMGPSPIAISKGISPKGHDCSPEKSTRGVFESTLRDLIDGSVEPTFGREIFVIEDTTCFLTIPPYSGGVFEGTRSYSGLLSRHKNRYGKEFSVRLGEDNPLSSAQKVLPNPQGSRQRLLGIFAGYVKLFWEGILLFVKVCGACPSCGRWARIPPTGRFPGRFCVGKLKCCPLTKLVGVEAANMVVVIGIVEKPGGGVISLPLVMSENTGFAWRIPILVTIPKMVLRHLKLFEGYWLQLGEDPIQALKGRPLNQRGGDANPIRTLGDYSKPSYEGYRNTIELPVRNNVVPFRSDTIWLVQNGCSFHRLLSEDPNQHLKDFLKLVYSLDLDGKNRERTRLRLFQFSLRDQASNWLERLPAGSITTWEDLTTHFLD